MIPGIDLSQFQGTAIDFNQVKSAGYIFGFTRMTYAYPGQAIAIDPTANANYYGMVSAGIYPGGYHKVGWTNAVAEADAFINAMSPLAKNDGLMYDIEPATDVAIPSNWTEWEQEFVQRIFDRTHTYPFRYLNISMTNSLPKQGIVVNCPAWVAAPSYSWNATLPVNNTSVIIQQGPAIHIPGIPMNICDTDMFFGTLADYLKCTYQPVILPSSQPVSQPKSVEPTVTPTPTQTAVNTPQISSPATVEKNVTETQTNMPSVQDKGSSLKTKDSLVNLHIKSQLPSDVVPEINHQSQKSLKTNRSWWISLLSSIWNFIWRG